MVWMNLLWGNGGDLFDDAARRSSTPRPGWLRPEQYIDFLIER
jgi:hypothetical protein